MRKRDVVGVVALAVLAAVVAGSTWVYARKLLGDDRPPIIVRGGSLTFEGGDPAGADPNECCNSWKKDLTSDEWKPVPDDKEGVAEFAVTVTGVDPSVCSMKDVRGESVLIYFQHGTERSRDWSPYFVKIERKFGIGKREPKIDPPGALTLRIPPDPKAPGRLEDSREGFISGVRVGGQACGFDERHKKNLAIRIQPKSVALTHR